jgi:hypothetical protein
MKPGDSVDIICQQDSVHCSECGAAECDIRPCVFYSILFSVKSKHVLS